MDIFFRSLPPNCSQKRLNDYLALIFASYGIRTSEFICEKPRKKPHATATILDAAKGQAFLRDYGPGGTRQLRLDKQFHCQVDRNQPDTYKLKSLEKKSKDSKTQNGANLYDIPDTKQYWAGYIACGVWTYNEGSLCFLQQYVTQGSGLPLIQIWFGKRELVLLQSMAPGQSPDKVRRIGMEYSSIQSMAICSTQNHILTITLDRAPKFYNPPPLDEEPIVNTLAAFSFTPGKQQRPQFRTRIPALDPLHAKFAESCLVYQISLVPSQIDNIKKMLKKHKFLPDVARRPYSTHVPVYKFDVAMENLCKILLNSKLPFAIKFQLQRLAQNAYLQPELVVQLHHTIGNLHTRLGLEKCVSYLQQLSKYLPFAGPDADNKYFNLQYLKDWLEKGSDDDATTVEPEISVFDLARRHPHLVVVHRARVTPAGIYLEGPYTETKNGVLEKYSEYAMNHFLRVSFEDENGELLKYEPGVTLEQIHTNRFKNVLNNFIQIGDQRFEFLGFSHSSLRDSSCWFLAPFEGMTSQKLIAQLGDFSHIRNPAKSGARIGQAFTDLNDNVHIPRSAVVEIPDIERNGRCFSDGCSTASLEVFEELWKHTRPGTFKPTTFQIRYGGVKGLISLDRSLKGLVLNIRPSQSKFPSGTEMLGICGAARRTLPLYLNRPMIKILEDLGVTTSTFMKLQTQAIDQLKLMTSSAANAATFAEIYDIGSATSLPWLIRELYYLGIDPLLDNFLWSAMELIVILRLRDIKYKGRIPISEEGGATLYGIMDETNTLEAGTVYCTVTDGNVLTGPVAVTRSPALHPGDIQRAIAVDVAKDHPLKDLHNVVVFSQQGERDLPSMLSGGDLDGDLFNVIIDPELLPKTSYAPADYPRAPSIDLGRPVEPRDISNHFINFMKNDQLGTIATRHLQLTDQKVRGTLDGDCIKLAELHSTAVDFSKTGIPVNMIECPRGSRCKPDFMATGPRMLMLDGKPTIDDGLELGFYLPEEDDVLKDLDPGALPTYFYESDKVLGHLFRAIDERKFLKDLQADSIRQGTESQSSLPLLWEKIQQKTKGILFDHMKPWARSIKEQYNNQIIDLAYQYALDPHRPLTELEVFLGIVMGKDGSVPSKRARDAANSIRVQFNDLVRYTVECIIKGEEEEADEEALERSLACFSVCLEIENGDEIDTKVGWLKGFGYLAGVVALRQAKRFARDGW